MTQPSLPTPVAIDIAKASSLDVLFDNKNIRTPLGSFQRLALVADFDTAFKAITPHLLTKPDEQQRLAFKIIHEIAKQDVLGMAVQALADIASSPVLDPRARTTAATILNDLFGEKQLIEEVKLTDKLTINMG